MGKGRLKGLSVMRIGSLIVAAPLAIGLAACGGEATDPTAPQGSSAAAGSSTTTIETPQGETITQQTGKDVIADLPTGFTIFPGANVLANTVTTFGNGRQTTIMMDSGALPAEIAAHYKDEAEEAGMEITIDLGFEGSNSIAADRTSDGLKLTVSASRKEGDEGTTVMLNIVEGQGG